MDKKELYESIMKEVAGVVKRRLNEASDTQFNMEALNNPENNLKIAQKQPDVYKCKQAPDKSLIGTSIQIVEIGKPADKVEITIYGKTFVDMCKKIGVIFMGALSCDITNLPEHGFTVELNSKFKGVWKKVLGNLRKETSEKIDDYGQTLYFQVFKDATSAQDVAAKLKTFKMK